MKRTFLLLLNLSLCGVGVAQQKQFTMSDAVLGLFTNLARQDIAQVQWIPGQNKWSQVVPSSGSEALLITSVPSLSVDTLLKSSDLDPSFKRFPQLTWVNDHQAYYQVGSDIFLCSPAKTGATNAKWLSLPKSADNIDILPNSLKAAYTAGNNLYYADAAGKVTAVTNDANQGIVNGQAVHRREFGIEKGTFFSPKGNFLAFYRMDESMVEQYPLIDWNTVPATMHYTRYPFAGRTSHQVSLGVFNTTTKQIIYLNTEGPKDQYLTTVTWSPDEKYLFVGLLNREQNHLALNKYDAQSGKLIKTLFEENDSKYIQPLHALHFLPGKNNEFIWYSQRDGFMHLYRYNTEGKLLNQVTKGAWLVNDILGAQPAKKELYFLASKDSPLEKHLYAVNWVNGTLRRLDTTSGQHTPLVSTNGTYVIDKWSNPGTPRNIDLFSTDNKLRKQLLSASDPLAGYQRPKVENVTVKADDGTPLYGKLIYPVNFDASKKYPVIVYLYNGPNVQIITNSYPASGNLWYEYMAQHGYFIFTMDGRGSSNRGLKFEQATFRQLGTIEMKDQMQGVNYLKSLPFIDAQRMGIHGWSFGGFMTTSFMLRQPGIFKCAVAGGPVMDWKMYEVMYTERYMDTPQENPKGYEDANLLSKVKNLKGKLLLIHGSIDSTVVWQNSIDFLKKAVDENVQVDYFVYPGHEHNVRGYNRIHLMQKITDYFKDNL